MILHLMNKVFPDSSLPNCKTVANSKQLRIVRRIVLPPSWGWSLHVPTSVTVGPEDGGTTILWNVCNYYRFTQRNISEDLDLLQHRCVNLKCRNVLLPQYPYFWYVRRDLTYVRTCYCLPYPWEWITILILTCFINDFKYIRFET